ncbi:MAG: PKD domain-containing protein [Gemmatimonadaceae bacterium]|nr:PKD domain-containing protein [Gemmatimonadaceae bacterium]
MLSASRFRIAAAVSALSLLTLAACHSITDVGSPTPQGLTPRLATIPAQGTATSLDIGNWNIEWFGDPANGPTNDSLQEANVKDVIAGADLDIWGVEEVVDTTNEWKLLKSQLPGYTGIVANEPIVVNGPQYYSDFSNTEQKVGILFKNSVATLLGAKIILTANDYDFAGRPPMEVSLRVTLNGATQDIVVIVLHNKCCSDATSWQRRQNASVALKNYLDTTYPTQKVWVIGDWNDDTDTSITVGSPTPWANFVSDAARYTFPTKALSDAHIASTVNYTDFIDHQLFTNEVGAMYIAGSASVLRADSYITNYGTTTTDHYPVFSRYDFGVPGAPTTTVTSPNGGETWLTSSVHNITWTSANIANVNLDYSLDGGGTWTAIAAGVSASTGSYSWTLPATTSTNAKVRVTDAASSTNDVSDAAFTITNTLPSVASYTYTCSGFTCSFNASASQNATSYSWNFGDNTTGSGVTVSHTFGVRKTYTVTLTTTPSGSQSSTSKAVTCTQKRCS